MRIRLFVLSVLLAAIALTAAAQELAGTSITFDGTTITVEGSGASVDGNTVIITAAGTYILSGTLTDGQVVVDEENSSLVTLVFNGIDLTSSTSAPIYVKEAGSVEIILADGTQNSLTDAATYLYENADDDEPNAALFSDDDLTISGSGSLTVSANFNDGISSKDTLTMSGGVITVASVDDGIRGKDALTISGGTLTITAQGDGLKADLDDEAAQGTLTVTSGSITIDAGDDGVSATGQIAISNGTLVITSADDAIHSDTAFEMSGGAVTIAAGDDAIHADTTLAVSGGSITVTASYEGLESTAIIISGGDINIVSSDDAINAAEPNDDTTTEPAQGEGRGMGGGRGGMGGFGGGNASLTISGGTIVVDAEGDGLDANGSISMSGGIVIVNGPTRSGNGALDYDGGFAISSGVFVAAGSAGMAQTADQSSNQNALLIDFTQVLDAGTLVHITNSAGDNVLTFAPAKTFQSIAFSSPDLVTGETYTIWLGGSTDGAASDGLYTDGAYSGGSQYETFTVSSVVTQVGQGGMRFR